MDLQMLGRNVELSEEVRKRIERKVRKLERHLPNIAKGVVEISQETTKSPQDRYMAQITITHNSGAILRGEEKAADIYSAVKSAVDVMDRRVERYKGVLYKKGRKAGPAVEREPIPQIVKEKRFVLQRMSTDEAAEQMELLGHDFFLFINQASGLFSLLYRRQDVGYGLIEAEER
jgi:putative sigma-54 modulation protein